MMDMYFRILMLFFFFQGIFAGRHWKKMINAYVHSSILRMVCFAMFGLDSIQPFALICKVPEQSSETSMLPFKSSARLR